MYGQFIFYKGGKGIQWEKDNLTISGVKTIDIHMQQKKIQILPHTRYKNKFDMENHRLNVRVKKL